MFGLVSDVASYPEFVPWLVDMQVRPADTGARAITAVDAEASVRFSFFSGRFETRVSSDPQLLTIDVELVRGPFRRLSNRWRFERDAGDATATRVDFDIDFAFKSRLLDALLNANMDRAVQRLIACFEARAVALYGLPEPPAA